MTLVAPRHVLALLLLVGCAKTGDADPALIRVVANGVDTTTRMQEPTAKALGDDDKREGSDLWLGIQQAWQRSNWGRMKKQFIAPSGMDDRGAPREAEALARIIVHDPCSLAVIGHLSSAAALAATTKVYANSRIPVILPSASASSLTRAELEKYVGHPVVNTFRLIPDDIQCQAPVLADTARKLSGDAGNIAVIYDVKDDVKDYAAALGRGVYNCLRACMAGKPAAVQPWPIDSSGDHVPQMLSDIAATSAAVIVFVGYASDFEKIGGMLESIYPATSRPVFLLSDGCMATTLQLPNFRVLIACPVALPASTLPGDPRATVDQALREALGSHNLVDFMFGYDALEIVLQASQHALDDHGEVTYYTLTNALEQERFHGWAETAYEFHDGENINAPYFVYDFLAGEKVSFYHAPARRYNASDIKTLRDSFDSLEGRRQ